MSQCPICKMRQQSILENWFLVDRLLFKTEAPKKVLTQENFKEYRKVKGAMLLSLYELYKTLGHISSNNYSNLKELIEGSYMTADMVLKNTVEYYKKDGNKLLESAVNQYKSENKVDFESAKNKVIPYQITESALEYALVTSVIQENTQNVKVLNSQQFNILNEAFHSFLTDLLKFKYNK